MGLFARGGIAVCFALVCAAGMAVGARPAWLTHPKVEDSEFRYYIGRASTAATEARAWTEATRDAYETAIRENFGFQTRVQSENYQALNPKSSENATTTRVVESSGKVEIHDFEQADSYEETADDGKVSLWVLFRYRKTAIEKERQRLAAAPAREPEPAFSEQGSDADASRGIVEVTTHPEGAVVFVDGERFGKTPLRLKGQLALGHHMLQLDHPSFAAAEQQLVVTPGTTSKIEVTLRPADAYLRVRSEPSGATVIVDGKPVGVTPTELLTVAAGRRILVEVTHPDSERATEELSLEKGATREVKLSLAVRPAMLSVLSDPSGATVVIRDADRPVKLSATPTGLLKLDPKAYAVTVSKPGFQPFETKVVLHGGDKTALPVVRLLPAGLARETAGIKPGAATESSEDGRAIAERWRQFVYRGFPDMTETKACYEKKKGLVHWLAGDPSLPAYQGLKAIAEGRRDDPNAEAGERLVNRLRSVEAECRKALETSPMWDGS